MLILAIVAVIATAGFAVILAGVLLVTIGVHQEEKRLTFVRRRGPTSTARIARRIVGRYVRSTEPEPPPVARIGAAPAPPGTALTTAPPQGRSAA